MRDHFVHLSRPDGPHGYETLAHHTAKHLIGRHLRQHFPDAAVHVDTEAVASGARPDVLLVLPDGRQVAYEVQYAALTPHDWQARHNRYAADGLRDVWLFGGLRYQRKPRYFAATEDARTIGPTLAAVLNSGHPLLLIDSVTEEAALGSGFDVVGLLAGEPRGGEFSPTWFPLDLARWPGGVLDLPGMRELLEKAAGQRESVAVRLREAAEGRRQLTSTLGMSPSKKRSGRKNAAKSSSSAAPCPTSSTFRCRSHPRRCSLRPGSRCTAPGWCCGLWTPNPRRGGGGGC